LKEKGGERYVRLAATRLLPVLNSFGSEFGSSVVIHLVYTRFHFGFEFGSPFRHFAKILILVLGTRSIWIQVWLSIRFRLQFKFFFDMSVLIGFIFIRSSASSFHNFRSTRLSFGLLFSCIWLRSFAVVFRFSSFVFRLSPFVFRLSPRGLWSIFLIYGSFVLKLPFRSVVLVSSPNLSDYASPAPTAAACCAFCFICTYGGSMLRSFVMSFVLSSGFTSRLYSGRLTSVGGNRVLIWGRELFVYSWINCRRILRTFSVRFVLVPLRCRENMEPSDETAFAALHNAEDREVVGERMRFAEANFHGYSRWTWLWVFNTQMSAVDYRWMRDTEAGWEGNITGVAAKNRNNLMAYEYSYCPRLRGRALGVPFCSCQGDDKCFDETRPPGQQFKYPTQPGAPLAKLLAIRQRTGRRPPIILKHIRWGVYHDKPFEPETSHPLPRHPAADSLVFPSPGPRDHQVMVYPPRGSPHEHTFVKPIPSHVVSALNDGAYLGYEDRRWREHEPQGITRKYLKHLLARSHFASRAAQESTVSCIISRSRRLLMVTTSTTTSVAMRLP
jgi:hypothetical protein